MLIYYSDRIFFYVMRGPPRSTPFPTRRSSDLEFVAGRFLHAASSKPPQPQSHYGEAIIPRNYIIKTWGGLFRLIEYMDNPVRLPQVLIVMQKIG